MRKFWFWIHWFLGIFLFLFLSITALSGAVLSFQEEILSWLNPQSLHVNDARAKNYLPSQILEVAQAAYPKAKISHIRYDEARTLPWVWIIQPGQKGHEGMYYEINPLTQAVALPKGGRFFWAINRLHRSLMLDSLGKHIVAITTLSLLLLVISGIYLYWGSLKKRFFASLKIDFKKRGRAFMYQLHSAAAMWMVPWYLLLCLSGLYWSYGWYAQALHTLSGVEAPMKRGGGGNPPMGNAAKPSEPLPLERLNQAWQLFCAHTPSFKSAELMSSLMGKTIVVRYVNEEAWHKDAFNTVMIDAKQMRIISEQKYEDMPVQAQVIKSMSSLHSGEFLGWIGRISAFIASVSMVLFVITGWMLYLERRRKKRKKEAIITSNYHKQGVIG